MTHKNSCGKNWLIPQQPQFPLISSRPRHSSLMEPSGPAAEVLQILDARHLEPFDSFPQTPRTRRGARSQRGIQVDS